MTENCFYFDGQTAKATECTIHIADDNLHIYFADEPDKTIIWSKINIKHFDLNGNQLIIKYGDFPQQTIECNGSNSSRFFDQLSERNLSKKSKSFWLKNKASVDITLCFVFVLMCLTTYFIVLPWVGEKSVAVIPKSAEIELGNSIAESILQSSTEEDSATYYTNLFVAKLKTNTSYSIQITVVESKEINAFALPGGRIFLYSEIVKSLNSYEELTALLGHEISHVSNQHSLKSICRTTASSLFIAFMFGDVTGISSGILQQADQFKQLNYSRELETQADDKGYELMLQNKISPIGMVNLLNLLKDESKEMPDFMKYLSTHPDTIERIKNIESKKEVKTQFDENQELKSIFEKIKYHLD